MMGWRPSLHAARALASSGLSCSLAEDFFETEPAGDQKLRKGRRVGFDTFGFRQFFRPFRHGDVIAGRHSSENKVPVGHELAMPEAAARPWINPAGLPP